MSQQEASSTLAPETIRFTTERNDNIIINSTEDLISNNNITTGRSQSDRIPRTITQPTFPERSKSNNTVRTSSNDSESAIQDQDFPSEITFEKRVIPKARTTSIQSVLSSVSLRSLAQQNFPNKNLLPGSVTRNPSSSHLNKGSPFIAPNSESQPQFINTKAHIQAPATAASSKLPSSLEIGQRLPFIKDSKHEDDGNNDQVESDGDAEDDGRLTVDALKNLTNFSKFIPAEVDMNITDEPDKLEPATAQSDASSLLQNHNNIHSASNLSLTNFGSFNSLQNSSATHLQSLRQPQPVPPYSQPPILRKNSNSIETKSRLLSSTTSSQNLPLNRSSNHLRVSTTKSSVKSPNAVHSPLSSASPQLQNPPHQHQNTLHSVPLSQSASIDPANIKGLSDLKRPMYVPAVLRQSPTNLNKDDVERINVEKLEKTRRLNHHAVSAITGKPSHWKLPFNDQNEPSSVATVSSQSRDNATRKPTNGVKPSRSLMNLQVKTSQPTRAHWRRDTSRNSCAYCSKPFTFFDRRHHCRKCGDIFCSEHTSHLVKLNKDAQFLKEDEFDGSLCKVCNNCFKDYEKVINLQYNVVNGPNQNVKSLNKLRKDSVTGNGSLNVNIAAREGNNGEDDKANEQTVGSVPVDWTWSSF